MCKSSAFFENGLWGKIFFRNVNNFAKMIESQLSVELSLFTRTNFHMLCSLNTLKKANRTKANRVFKKQKGGEGGGINPPGRNPSTR
jgi:hypothetical protein